VRVPRRGGLEGLPPPARALDPIGGTTDFCFVIPSEITTACRPWKKYSIRYWIRPALALSS
jgi:hypothetical protein